MKVEDFNKFLSENSISKNSWQIYYNFSNVTGGLVLLNELYPYSGQFDQGCVYTENNPGLIVGINTGGFILDGSGYFSGDSIVRLSNTLDPENWTIFMTYRNSGCQIDRDKGTILFSNQTNISDRSGLSLGFNGANKFFIEYNEDFKKNIFTSNYEGKNNTCISLSKNQNDFEFSVHDIGNQDNTLENFKLTNYINSNIYYLGNVYNLNKDYTGFKGYIDDFIYLSGFIGFEKRNNLAKGIFCSGINPAYQIQIISGYNKISSSYITTGLIIGTGITGYQNISIGTIPTKNGGVIQICELSGVLGPIYGEQIVFQTGGATVTGKRFIYINVPEEPKYDFSRLQQHANNRVKLLYPIDPLDFIEINTYTGFLDNYREISSFDNFLNQFAFDKLYTGQRISLFVNGVFQPRSGFESNEEYNYYISASGGYSGINSNGYYDLNDNIVYFDRIPNTTYNTIAFTGLTGPSSDGSYPVTIAALASVNDPPNLFLNGQKLISGFDYTGRYSSLLARRYYFINPNLNFTTGRIYLTSSSNHARNSFRFTGHYLTITGDINPLTEEQLYLNGILQINNQDYIKTNCQSLLNSLFYPTKKTYNYYNNNDNSFNLL